MHIDETQCHRVSFDIDTIIINKIVINKIIINKIIINKIIINKILNHYVQNKSDDCVYFKARRPQR